MSTGLIDIMKRASVGAIEASKPCDLRYGTVISANPLKIRVTNQLVLTAGVLIVPQHLTNHTVDVSATINLPESSTGSISRLTINNALKSGDKVALLRESGGQRFYVLDRI